MFDFDGTLVDSTGGIIEVMKDVINENKLPDHILAEWQVLIGVPLMRQMEIIFPDGPEEYWLQLATRYREIYDAKTIELCPLFPGLRNMLERLQQAGVKITVATSKRRPLVETVLNYHDLMKYFTMLVGAQDVVNHKPHPETVFKTLEQLHLAGVDAIGVTTGVHSAEVLSRSEPKYIVKGLDEVLPIILNGRNGKLAS
jgi:phosphoglycolate phosphatase